MLFSHLSPPKKQMHVFVRWYRKGCDLSRVSDGDKGEKPISSCSVPVLTVALLLQPRIPLHTLTKKGHRKG